MIWAYLNKIFTQSRINANWIIAFQVSFFRSQRAMSLLYRLFSHECVLSTTQRIGVNLKHSNTSVMLGALLMFFLQGINGKKPRFSSSCLHLLLSYPLSASTTIVVCWGANLLMRSISFMSSSRSLPLAPVDVIPRQCPWASTNTWSKAPLPL